MTAYRQATAAAGTVLARAYAELAETAATGGPGAVADAAWYPGHHLTREEIAARYHAIQQTASAKAA